MAARTRRALSPTERAHVYAKTAGHCHICGGPAGVRWHADHVVPHAKGGVHRADNYLPACGPCNRLRWHRGPGDIRRILLLGIYAARHMDAGTKLGRKLSEYVERRRVANRRRRKVYRLDE